MLSIINELPNDDGSNQEQSEKVGRFETRDDFQRVNGLEKKSDEHGGGISNNSDSQQQAQYPAGYLLHGQKLSDYDDLGEIGRGQFGTVHKVRSKKNPDVLLVWKKLHYEKMSSKERKQLQQEVQLLQTLRHPGIVRFIGKVHDPCSAHLYLLMEFCDGGDLGRYLDHTVRKGFNIPEDLLLVWFAQLVDALHYCHTLPSGQVFHRDIKPQNVLMCQEFKTVKLGDFGLAKMLSPQQTLAQTHVGTPYYMSPEVLTRNQYDAKSDIWSLGCLLYEMATGNSPHAQATTLEGLQNLVNTAELKPLPVCYTKELFSLIKWMLTKKPSHRPSTKDLRKTLAFRMGCLLHFADTMAQVEEKKKQADQVIRIVKEKNVQLRNNVKELQKLIASQRVEILRLKRGVLEEKAPYRMERVPIRRQVSQTQGGGGDSSTKENKNPNSEEKKEGAEKMLSFHRRAISLTGVIDNGASGVRKGAVDGQLEKHFPVLRPSTSAVETRPREKAVPLSSCYSTSGAKTPLWRVRSQFHPIAGVRGGGGAAAVGEQMSSVRH